jgi:hypothetical protein
MIATATDTFWLVAFVLAVLAVLCAGLRRADTAWLVPLLGWASVAMLALGALVL